MTSHCHFLTGEALQRRSYCCENDHNTQPELSPILTLVNASQVKLYIGMTPMQRKWYKDLLNRDVGNLNTLGGPDKMRLLNILMQLRKVKESPEHRMEGAKASWRLSVRREHPISSASIPEGPAVDRLSSHGF